MVQHRLAAALPPAIGADGDQVEIPGSRGHSLGSDVGDAHEDAAVIVRQLQVAGFGARLMVIAQHPSQFIGLRRFEEARCGGEFKNGRLIGGRGVADHV